MRSFEVTGFSSKRGGYFLHQIKHELFLCILMARLMDACVCARERVLVCACVCVRVIARVYTRARACVCECACVYVCLALQVVTQIATTL